MFGSEILEIAIGLILVYLLMSLICSAVSEWIARMLALRSKTLLAGVRNLLNDDTHDLASTIYEHPLVNGLFKKGAWDKLIGRIPKLKGTEGPSHISPRTFALTLLDTVIEAGGGVPSEVIGEGEDTDPRGKSKSLQLNARRTLDALTKGVESEEFKAPEHVKKALRGIISSAKAESVELDRALAKVRTSVEQWFDDSMERVSGWYRRKAQLIIIVLAFALGLGFNVDTFVIANTLSRDATLRASVVAAAEARAMRETAPPTISDLRGELSQLGVPMGWTGVDSDDPRKVPSGFAPWVVKIFGVLFTAFAVAMGAPFWFDLLNKVVNLRGGGSKPTRTSEEAPQNVAGPTPAGTPTA